jgi:hypothetical protein
MRQLSLVVMLVALAVPAGASAASWTDTSRPKASWTDSKPTASWTDSKPTASWTDRTRLTRSRAQR